MLAAGTRGPDGLDLGAPISLTTMEPPLLTALRPADPDEAKAYHVDELVYYRAQLQKSTDDAAPSDTVVGYLNHAEIDGRPLRLQEKMRLCQQFSRAGLHTTVSTLGNMI
jgi:cytochrome P450